MIEVKGDLFTYIPEPLRKTDGRPIRVITTNFTVKKNGEAVMGRGCALQAKTMWPDLPRLLGTRMANNGLTTHAIYSTDTARPLPKGAVPGEFIVCFPVKYHWMQPASLELIEKSAHQLAYSRRQWSYHRAGSQGIFLMPRPGCGNGRLNWNDVKPALLRGIESGSKKSGQDGYNDGYYGGAVQAKDWLYVISPE